MIHLSRRIPVVFALLLCSVAVARAQQPPRSLQIRAGLVTLHAENVPVRQILSEWARVGGTKVVNGEGVNGAPVTLDLTNVPERQALDIVLRGVAGYVLGARAPSAPGASSIDRILILASSVAPRNVPQPPTPGARFPQPLPQPQFEPDDVGDPTPPDVQQPPRIVRPGPNSAPGPNGLPGTVVQPLPQPANQPLPDDVPSPVGPVTITPTNPFGVPTGSSQTPGTVTPVPPAPGPTQSPGRRIQEPD